MNSCKWDRERETYMHDGEPCRRDEYGDPTRHCTARRTCANHVGPGELTCARCLGRTRQDIRAIVTRACELLPEALEGGSVNTELVNLAGPATDVEAWSWRKIAAKQGVAWHASLIEDDDEHHPYSVLTRWEFMLREDYGQQRADATSVSSAADYLERTLPRMAQDAEQDFPLFAREMRKCRSHIEAVLRDSQQPTRGAPCPTCAQRIAEDRERVGAKLERAVLGAASADKINAPRLQLEHGHWCDDEDCERIHHADDRDDRWVCPRDRAHAWSEEDYRRWVADVYEANRTA